MTNPAQQLINAYHNPEAPMSDNIYPLTIGYNGREYVDNTRAVSRQQYEELYRRRNEDAVKHTKEVGRLNEKLEEARERVAALESKDAPAKQLKNFSREEIVLDLARRLNVDVYVDRDEG